MPRKIPPTIRVGNTPSIPASRVELHVHLDGAPRYETIWELSKAKNLPLPGNGTLHDLKNAIQIQQPVDLKHFLESFQYFAPAFTSDLDAIERMSYEFCEDKFRDGLIYVEARFSPHLMTTAESGVNAEHVVKAVLKGFQRGENDFGIKARVILCLIRGLKVENNWEDLKLAEKFRNEGVVAIDVAGDEGGCLSSDLWEGIKLDQSEIDIFNEARKLGIHRTVHAGEAGPAGSVRQALEKLHAERIGHGYRVVEDAKLYQRCLDEKIHFETCPHSSLLTGAVSLDKIVHHSIVQFASDGANFSINTDDPTLTDSSITDEYKMLNNWGLTEAHFVRANFNAQKSCFLPQNEKEELGKQLRKNYGIDWD